MHLAMSAHRVWPSAILHDIGTPEYLLSQGINFAAQYPACTSPCQRFARAVTRARA